MELRQLTEVLQEPLDVKINYIRGDLSKKVNELQRGASHNYKQLPDIYKHIFNSFEERPRGELSELKSVVTKCRERSICLGELADFLYYAIGFDRGSSVAGESSLASKAIDIGKKLGLKPVHVVDGCIIKYNSRALRKKSPSHEINALEDYLGKELSTRIKRMQKRRAIKEIAKLLAMKEHYARIIPSQ